MPFKFESSRALKTAGLAVFCLSFISCTSFRGPGEYQGPSDQAPLPVSPAEATGREPAVARSHGRLQAPVKFDWPVDEARLTRGYINTKRSPHWGLDLANRKGTPILAAEKGVVVYTGREFRGFGKLIVIEHDAEWATLYSHLDQITVKEGELVERGQPIGLMGRTGRATGVHLHFEIRRNRQPVNPLTYLPAP